MIQSGGACASCANRSLASESEDNCGGRNFKATVCLTFGVFGLIDDAHHTLTEGFDNIIMRYCFANHIFNPWTLDIRCWILDIYFSISPLRAPIKPGITLYQGRCPWLLTFRPFGAQIHAKRIPKSTSIPSSDFLIPNLSGYTTEISAIVPWVLHEILPPGRVYPFYQCSFLKTSILLIYP